MPGDSVDAMRTVLGTWRLLSYERRGVDGTPMYPFGDSPIGYLVYTEDGHVLAQFMRSGAREFMGTLEGEAPESRAGFAAYAGTYEVVDSRVIHHVELSLDPQRVGKELVRHVEWDGDRLVLRVLTTMYGPAQGLVKLTWERVAARCVSEVNG